MPPVPELPGNLVPAHSDQENWLKHHVARLCQLDHERFPGSQPVSFSVKDLDRLEKYDFWVCEKSDGIRVLFLVQTAGADQSVYLIDRKNTYRQLTGFFFPHYENPQRPLGNTIVDGELVLDVDPTTGKQTLRMLAFDCLVIDNQNVMARPLDKRYGRLAGFFFTPYKKMMKEFPQMAAGQPFEIKVKEMSRAYAVEKVFTVDIPALQHGNDGLIYTCVTTPYVPATDENILKWKPPSENSIDFKLVLRFPAKLGKPNEIDWQATPIFALFVWGGGDRYEPYDVMRVEEEEWERLKASGEQVDDRIVEVHWDPEEECWRMMRFRDDKPHGNHKDVVEKIIDSIADGVGKDVLLQRATAVRTAWKEREAQGQQPQPPPVQGRPGQAPSHIGGTRGPAAPPNPATPQAVPPLVLRYGPLAQSRWSKVAGPLEVAGMHR